ncbi:MAG: heavy-metal-associated domain-containing protein [Deltaproteobacteria bacterium]|nr:heavy-metal-associated domain-containing protein [Deltaproteobacteria bacterium]
MKKVKNIARGLMILIGILVISFSIPILYGASLEKQVKTEKLFFEVKGMKNPKDVERIKSELRKNAGVFLSNCDHTAGTCTVDIDPAVTKWEAIVTSINQLGFKAIPSEKDKKFTEMPH